VTHDAVRKLTTVVAVDVAGYSARTEADEAAATAEVSALHGVIEQVATRYAGRIFNTAGDGFMLEFLSSLAAVEAALELAELCEPKVRVGVHVGDVIVRPNGDLLGHGVNVAARLMAKCDPGSALISADVRRMIRGPLADRLIARGPLHLDKMAETIDVYASSIVVDGAPANAAPPLPRREAAPDTRRLAVLPFQNLSPDPTNAFFADGLQEEILHTLASASLGINIISRTTMMSYKDRRVTLAELVRDLGCSHVIEGTVRREVDNVRLTLQLVDAKTDTHIWSRQFDRTLQSVMTLQSEVAFQVAAQLSVTFPRPPAAVTRPPVRETAAYDFYLRARIARAVLQGSSPLKAWRGVEGLLNQAISADRSFVAAYIERIVVHHMLFMRNYDASEEMHDRMRADLAAAEKLAPDDPGVTAARGLCEYAEQKFEQALASFDAAEASGLVDPELLQWKANLLFQMGRYDDSRAIYARLLALDPGNLHLLSFYWTQEFGARRPREALRLAHFALARAPESVTWLMVRAGTKILYTGDGDEWFSLIKSLANFEIGVEDDNTPDKTLVLFSMIVERRYDEVRRIIDEAPVDSIRINVLDVLPVNAIGRMPLAATRGWADLLLGDAAAAAEDGAKLLAFVAKTPESRWNAWLLRALEAEGRLLAGDKAGASAGARESIAYAMRGPDMASRAVAKHMAATVLAWAGCGDEAVALLEELAVSKPGLAPLMICIEPMLITPLGESARYQALCARLSEQLMVTKAECSDLL
jgi:adenylate cyclase